MFRKMMWKFFPPKFVSQEDVDNAHEMFDNVRNNRSAMGYNYDGVVTDYDVIDAENYFTYMLNKRKKYLEYTKIYN